MSHRETQVGGKFLSETHSGILFCPRNWVLCRQAGILGKVYVGSTENDNDRERKIVS